MKQKDIALIVVVSIISGAVSFFVAQYFFLKPESKQIKAEYVQAISTDFSRPDTKYFNQNSINPTQQIQIGDGGNTSPYNAAAQ
jgi:capsular polysaccharide biosynthesis protein